MYSGQVFFNSLHTFAVYAVPVFEGFRAVGFTSAFLNSVPSVQVYKAEQFHIFVK
jgi:hypothetical protein